MKPEEAYKRLIESGPFDDPSVTWYPYRWYWHEEDGKFYAAVQAWRSIPTIFYDFIRPVTVLPESCNA